MKIAWRQLPGFISFCSSESLSEVEILDDFGDWPTFKNLNICYRFNVCFYILFLLTNIFIIDAGLLWDLVWAKKTSDLLVNGLLLLDVDCCTSDRKPTSGFGESS